MSTQLRVAVVFTTFLVFSPLTHAQSPLDLRVVDATGAPVAGARVRASTRDGRLSAASVTDTDGRARLPVRCECLVEVEAAGFAPAVAAVPADAPAVTVALAVASIAEHVVVTAAAMLQSSTETTRTIDVVDAREIDARAEFAVADALRTVPGLTVQQLGGPGAFTSIKMRGLREQDTAVLIDGVRFRDPTAPQGDATGFVGELYLANLDRVEILRGSGSSVHGSHAVAGAVNLVTRRGGGQPSGDVAVDVGQLGFHRVSGHAGGGAARDIVTYSVGVSDTRTTRGVDGDDRAVNTSVQAHAEWRPATAARLLARTYVSDSAAALNDTPSAIGPFPPSGPVKAIAGATFVPSPNDPDARRDGRFGSTLVSFNHRASARVGYSAALHHLRTTRAYLDGPLGVTAFEPPGEDRTSLRGGHTTVDLRADVDWSPRHTTTARYEIEQERYDSEARPAFAIAAWNADLRQTSRSLFLQQQWRPARWQVQGGVRLQHFTVDRASFTPSERAPFAALSFATPPAAVTGDLAASRWFETSSTKVHAHVGNAYRAPSMFERAGASFGSRGYTVYGDPRLPPERSVSVDAGVDQTLAGGRLHVAATWFHARLLQVIAFGAVDATADPFGRSAGYRSADGRTAQGVETAVRLEPFRGTTVKGAYTFADAEAPAGNPEALPRAAAVPAHQLSVLAIQQVRRLQVAVELEAASDHYVALFDPITFAARAYGFAGAARCGIATAYVQAIGRARLKILGAIDNLFDRRDFVQGFRTAGRTARVGAGVTF